MHSCWHLHILGWAARQRSMPAFWGMQPWQSVLKYTLVNFHYLPVRRFTFKFSLWYSVYCEKHPSFVSEPPGTDKALIHCSPSTPSYVLPTHAAACAALYSQHLLQHPASFLSHSTQFLSYFSLPAGLFLKLGLILWPLPTLWGQKGLYEAGKNHLIHSEEVLSMFCDLICPHLNRIPFIPLSESSMVYCANDSSE